MKILSQSTGILIGRKLVDFTLTEDDAKTVWAEWVKRGFLVPKDVADRAEITGIDRILMPYFIYNCQVAVQWQGYGGDYRIETVAGSGGASEVKKTVEWVHQSGVVQDELLETRLGTKDVAWNLRRFFNKFDWQGKPAADWRQGIESQFNATAIPFELDAEKIFNREFKGKLFRRIESAVKSSVHGEETRGITWRKHLEYRYLELYAPYYAIRYNYNGREYLASIDATESNRISGKKPRRSILALFGKTPKSGSNTVGQ